MSRSPSDVGNLSPEERSVIIIGLIDRNNAAEREIAVLEAQNADYRRNSAERHQQPRPAGERPDGLARANWGGSGERAGGGDQNRYALRAADMLALINEIRKRQRRSDRDQ
jgi:hypothetical protein